MDFEPYFKVQFPVEFRNGHTNIASKTDYLKITEFQITITGM